MTTRPRFPWGLTVVCALAFVLLAALGVWQVQRMQWKNGLIAEAEAAGATPASDASTAFRRGEFARVSMDCPGLATAPYVELQTIHDGESGVRLISACRPTGSDFAILVDRGFVSETISARPPVAASTVPVRVEGQLRQPTPPGPMALPPEGRRFFARDHVAMAEALGAGPEVMALMVYATTSSNPEWLALQPSAPPAAFTNNHLGYALTWFGLALALAGFYIALLRRKPKS
ncbi:SURF1 family protein [Brevundimonas sp. Root1423]|uniref:SURF1 family protein n=1 Tax=Brevundimonas sp. Root1423 TaxID=1736462 RepID=UPI0006FE2601|nr:SURF1 family protein [Brevundimonas sp. Root1423]KQY80489.1 Surfeit locus 1 family protein [Brevundimonas sp. Root1423]